MEAPESRYYENLFPDPLVASEAWVEEKRVVLGPRFTSLYHELMQHAGGDPHARDYSVYTGTGGLAYLTLKVGLGLGPPQGIGYFQRAKTLLMGAKGRIQRDRRKERREDVTFIMGPPGIYSQLAVLHTIEGDEQEAEQAAREVLRQKERVLRGDVPFEVLYGAAGYLYALLFVKAHAPELIPASAIEEVVAHIFNKAEQHGPDGVLLPPWHGKQYLGGAHGVTGILSTVLDAHRWVPLTDAQMRRVRSTVEFVHSLCLPSGNYPTRPSSSGDDRLVQWCHGAPGPLLLFVRAFEVLKDARYLAWAETASDVVWERGLLQKGVGLCHGVSGNAYCFLALHRATGNDRFLQRALQFALAADDLSIRQASRPDHPWSLFEGAAGLAMLYFDLVAARPAYFPAVEVASP